MADEEDGNSEESDEEGGGGLNLPLIIGGVIVVVLIAVAVWFFMFYGGDEDSEFDEEITIEEVDAEDPAADPLFLDLGSRVVNLMDGRRYLKTTIQLLIVDQAVFDYLRFRMVEVKAIVLSELQEISSEDIDTKQGREELKAKLIRAIKKTFPSRPDWDTADPIRKLLFLEFMLQ